MPINVTRLLRVARNVVDLDQAVSFYVNALGFCTQGPAWDDAALAHLLGIARVRVARLWLGQQQLELSQCFPPGAVYPRKMPANDIRFQHIAIITNDIAAAYSEAMQRGLDKISRNGPAHLPRAAGGVSAFKFRDPDGHPLEFLQTPETAASPHEGFDHSAISVSNVGRAEIFYAGIGVRVAARQVNQGPEQDALDGLANVAVEVVALRPPFPTPHMELLGYRSPDPGPLMPYAPTDICADRLVFESLDGEMRLLRDPDGHVILVNG